jgi:hypothetical protein
MTMSRHQPALLGGLLIGALSSIPIISLANCCCLWVISGGMLTVYLQQQSKPEPVETGDAVIGGLMAGLIGAVIVCVVSYVKLMVLGPVVQTALENVRQQLEGNPDIPAGMRDFVLNMIGGSGMLVMTALITIPLYAVFGMLGALLGTALFRKKQPPVVQG